MKIIGKDHLNSLGLLFLRVMTGVGAIHHGYPKIFGGHIHQFAEAVAKDGAPFPLVAAWAAALSEFGGGILITLGLKARLGALFLFLTMSFAVFIHHAHDPLQVKELALAYWAASGAIMLVGAGRLSLDRS